jgi:hypothetical protein
MGRGDRWLTQEKNAARRRSHKDHIICNMRDIGFSEIPKIKIAEGLSRVEAASLEVSLIAAIGRLPNGPLVNYTAGGEGITDPSPETRAKISAGLVGKKRGPQSEELIEKRRQGLILAYEEERRPRKSYMEGKRHSEEAKKQISESNSGQRRSENTCRKMSESALRAYAEGRKSKPVGMTGKRHTEEFKEQRRAYRHTEEARRRMSEIQGGREPASEETCRKISEAKKGKPQSEEARRVNSESHKGKPWSEARRLAQRKSAG